eukprot:6416633-Amphidinium_carterae.1
MEAHQHAQNCVLDIEDKQLGDLCGFQRIAWDELATHAKELGMQNAEWIDKIGRLAKKHEWGLGRKLSFGISSVVNKQFAVIDELCERNKWYALADGDFINEAKELHESVIVTSMRKGNHYSDDIHGSVLYLHNLCGRGLFPPKKSIEQEVLARETSSIAQRKLDLNTN